MKDRETSMLLITVCFVVLATVFLDALKIYRRPKRCCTPDQWEADVELIGTTNRIRDPDHNLSAKYSYDFDNRRWAFDYRDRSNRKNNKRFVFDHKSNFKYVVTYKGCYNVSLDAPMGRWCVPENATYHGFFEGVSEDGSLDYDVWSYEFLLSPMRVMLKVTRDQCLALQDSAYTLIRNQYQWSEGEPPCVPWQHPDRAASGDCYKSHTKSTVRRSGTRPTAFLSNMDFRNVNTSITNEDVFHLPRNCQTVDDWPNHVQWNDFFRMLIVRNKRD